MAREASVERNTKETEIKLKINRFILIFTVLEI